MKTVQIDLVLDLIRKGGNIEKALTVYKKQYSEDRVFIKLLNVLVNRQKLLTPKPEKIKEVKPLYEQVCLMCKEPFLSKYKNTKYCKPSHYPSYKERKRIVKRFNEQAKPPWMSWFKLSLVYASKPEGYQVDHIIPLNHPDVCGLHVPWNLQYLSPEDNLKKSNRWDGTYDNETWRNT